MANWIFEHLKTTDITLVTDIFLAIILGVWLFSLWAAAKSKHPGYVDFAPTLLTSLGILGTFIGITLGLAGFDFDTQATIDESLPNLLGGLKMAFITSIFGMAVSLITRSFSMWCQKSDSDDPDEIGAEELYREMKLHSTTLVKISEQIHSSNKILIDTKKSIAGEGDASVVTQIQKMRSDIKDGFHDMQSDFQKFAEKVSEIGTKQLIEALNEVIRDFNKNLTEQFGENFKRLDESVAKLVVWQEEYRQQMQVMKDEFEFASQGIEASKTAMEGIREEASQIPVLMDMMKGILESTTSQLGELEDHLFAFKEMRDKAVEAVPEITNRMNEITDSINESVNEATKHHNELVAMSSQMIEAHKKSSHELHQQFVSEVSEQVDWITTHLKDTSNKIVEANNDASIALKDGAKSIHHVSQLLAGEVQKSSETLQGVVDQVGQRAEQQVRQVFESIQSNTLQLSQSLQEANAKAAKERNEFLNQELKGIDESMQAEIGRAMQQMADQLGRITGKFVQDYSELTEKMKQVVEQGREQ